MPVLIADAAVVRDLDGGRLLTALSGLPFSFFTVDVLADGEISPQAVSRLRAAGVRTVSLGPRELAEAIDTHREQGRLSLGECCALAFARMRKCPMLTTYGPLREAALNHSIPVRCILWCLDQTQATAVLDATQLCASLQSMVARARCTLPPEQVALRLAQWASRGEAATTRATA